MKKQLVIYIHGKGGNAEEAEHYKKLFPKASGNWFHTEEQMAFLDDWIIDYK